ncbi:hypothetical protein BCR35DRAFT_333245 [Leucosporidium creatinivorum]|uniref:Uncharacterized protein n=1 Tax=Leucosporidium creatinivorum TaxID=106004 RepID=A0A1Y2EW46_9BASI|nr:hypothetical protein BCR35DRAFT_333245 [Leucosporidium creatinivorum]
MKNQSTDELHVELRNILGGPNPSPDAFIPRLHALELRRLRALEHTTLFANDSELSEEEKQFVKEVHAKLKHPEQARLFEAIDILWRCLAVEQNLTRKDAAGARSSLKHFAADEVLTPEAPQLDRLALFRRHEERRTTSLEIGQPLKWEKTDKDTLRRLSVAYVGLVAALVTAVEDYVTRRIEEAQQPSQPSQPSQGSESLPTPSPTSPLTEEVHSPHRDRIRAPTTRSASQSPSQSRKRSAEAMEAGPAERRASSPVAQTELGDAMDLDMHGEVGDALGEWVNADDSPTRQEKSALAMDVEGADVLPFAAPALAPIPANDPSSSHDDDDFAATQPPQKLVHQPLLSKLGMAAKINAEKLAAEKEAKRQAEKDQKAAAKLRSAQASTSAVPPPRPVGPSASTILMPPPPAVSSDPPSTQLQPQPQPQPSSAPQSSQKSGSGEDSGEASTSQELPPAAQSTRPPPPATSPPHPSSSAPGTSTQVLVPATQSSNESQESSAQPLTQAVAPYYTTDESQEKDEAAGTQPREDSRDVTSSLEYVTTDGEEPVAPASVAASTGKEEKQTGKRKSFGDLEGEATSGPEDEEAMKEVGAALAENGSSSHSNE